MGARENFPISPLLPCPPAACQNSSRKDHLQSMVHSDGLILSYYGDDFTGSTDVMESLSFAGVKTVLFMAPPTAEQIAQFEGVMAVGVAGRTRSMSAQEMAQELVPVYTAFRELDTPIVHYKTCSTFDSSPEIGSIGQAIDLGQSVFGGPFVPLVVGAPVLKRYCVFGNLYARSGLDSDVFRLDRHPTMRHHPITPMDESDLRRHLAKQTDKEIELFDVLDLELEGDALEEALLSRLSGGAKVMLFDTLSESHLPKIGRLLWQRTGVQPLFVAGSSGAEYALVAHWQEANMVSGTMALPPAGSADQLVVVSGSCSPVTADQIDRAEQQGFETIALNPILFVDEATADVAIDAGVRKGLAALSVGKNVILHTGRGPNDSRIERTVAHLKFHGFSNLDVKLRSGAIFGRALGRILREILMQSGLKRAATTGGDTSYYVAQSLGVEALEAIAPLAPGSPLCRVYGEGLDGVEMTFKGGQVGTVDFFSQVLKGKAQGSERGL